MEGNSQVAALELLRAAARRLRRRRQTGVAMSRVCDLAGVSQPTGSRYRAVIEREFPSLLAAPAPESLRAAARQLVEQQQTGVTMSRVSELAGVSQPTGSKYRAVIEREFPGLLAAPAPELLRAAARQLVEQQQTGVAMSRVSELAGVSRETGGRCRAVIEREFPGLLAAPAPELLRAAARELLEQQQTGVAMSRVSELAGISRQTGSRYRAVIEREFPSLLAERSKRSGPARELLRAAARQLVEQQQTDVAMTRVSELAGVSRETGSRYRAVIEREFPSLLAERSKRSGPVVELLRAAARQLVERRQTGVAMSLVSDLAGVSRERGSRCRAVIEREFPGLLPKPDPVTSDARPARPARPAPHSPSSRDQHVPPSRFEGPYTGRNATWSELDVLYSETDSKSGGLPDFQDLELSDASDDPTAPPPHPGGGLM